jgi:hypothetical protein
LKHRLEDEGIILKLNSQNAYIPQYAQTTWDKGHPQHYPAIGFINSGPMLDEYGSNQRTFIGTIGSSSYFTKLTGKGDTLAQAKLWFNAQRTDWSHVRPYWRTNPEVNTRYFIVQRRLGNDTSFVAVDTINSKALGGISYTDLLYEMSDPNDFSGISYYRLMQVDYGGNISYSNIVPVGGRPAGYGLLVWPNPNRGRFFVGINGEAPVSRIMIWNIVGQKIHEEKVSGRNIIEMRLRIPGSYVVGFISTSGNIIDTKKILVPVIGY